MKYPLAWISFFFSLGIFTCGFLKPYWGLLYILNIICLVISITLFRQKQFFLITLFLFIFFLGMFWLASWQKIPDCHISRLLHAKGENFFMVKGVVKKQLSSKGNKASLVLETKEIIGDGQSINCCGDILVHYKAENNISYGQELLLRGYLRLISASYNPRQQNYQQYLTRQGISVSMHIPYKKGFLLRSGQHNKANLLLKASLWLKNKIEKLIYRRFSSLHAAILDAMILGEKKNIPPLVYNSFVKTGTVHILVVSGFNVGIIAVIIILCLKLLRLTQTPRLWITIPLIIFYCFIAGASTPVVRATIMAVVFLLAHYLKRQAETFNALGLAVISILIFNPNQLFDIGFQLSFTSVISIAYLYPRLRTFFRLDHYSCPKIVRYLFDSCLVSFSAWLGTVWLIAYYFKIFSPVTVLANILIVPLATLITFCGLAFIIIAGTFPIAAVIFAAATDLPITLLLLVNSLLVKLPVAYISLQTT